MSRTMTKYGDLKIHTEWQTRKKDGLQFKRVEGRRGRLGEFQRSSDGTVTYWSERRAQELVFCKEGWPFGKQTAMLLGCLKPAHVGVVLDNGDRWRISYQDFIEKRQNDTTGRVPQWVVPFEHFEFEKGEPETIEQAMKIGKWK